MRPGYLQGYGEDITKPGNFGYAKLDDDAIYFLNNRSALPPEFETGYIPDYMKYPRALPYFSYPATLAPIQRRMPAPRDPMTFNVLMI